MAEVSKGGEPVQPLFGPFACVAVNSPPTICLPHRDSKNVMAGVCCIIPFGHFEPTSARLVVGEIEVEIEVAAGVPIFIPSAIFTHWNTQLEGLGVRGSVVYWSGASLLQWAQLGYRALKTLSEEEASLWRASAQSRLKEGLDRFPLVD